MNAHAKIAAPIAEEPKALPDGSMLVTSEQLAILGNGDPKRGRRELRLLLESERDAEVFDGPTNKPDSVRVALPADEAAVLALWLEDLRENAPKDLPIDEARMMEFIRVGTQRRGGIVGVIDGPDKKPVAFCIIVPEQWMFSKAYYLREATNYVHPDHRKSRHIHDLIQFERWAADQWSKNCGWRVYMLFSVLGGKRVREKVMLYGRKLRQCGRLFLYPSPHLPDNQ